MLFGVQSMHAYVQFGWLPQIYRDAGISASSAGALQALLSSVGILGALIAIPVAAAILLIIDQVVVPKQAMA